MKYVQSPHAPAAVGPYSQAIVHNGLVYCSGQIGLNPQTNTLVSGIKEQTKQVLTNLAAVLEEAHSDMEMVLKTTVYLADSNDYTTMNEIYATFFTSHKPARAAFAVAQLPKDALIEIECIAAVKE